MNNINWLTKEQIMNIPKEHLPLFVLSRYYFSRFATEISIFDRSLWNHTLWMIHPGKFVSQDFLFREVPAEKYLSGEHQLKFWHSLSWLPQKRLMVIDAMEEELKKNWFFRRYDFLQIIGIKLHLRQLQIPWLHICSDRADYLKILDSRYREGMHLTPGEVNEWFKKCSGNSVYGKFTPDD